MNFNISLTEEQCKYFLSLMEDRPFKEVLQLYGTLELQMNQQRQEAQSNGAGAPTQPS